jgi:BRCT domain type II-containing protein
MDDFAPLDGAVPVSWIRGARVMLTGTMWTGRSDIVAAIQSFGAHYVGTVTNATMLVVATEILNGSKEATSKVKEARGRGVKIVTENQLKTFFHQHAAQSEATRRALKLKQSEITPQSRARVPLDVQALNETSKLFESF